MSKGSFIVFQDTEHKRDIHFKLASNESNPSEAELQLRDEVDRANLVLKAVFPAENSRFEEYFRSLLSLSQLGLVGDSAQPTLASRALVSLKAEIVNTEAGRVKNNYMIKLGVAALISAGASLLAAIILLAKYPVISTLPYFLFLWAGCMAGVWISFGTRKADFTFEDLSQPEKDFLLPSIRLIFAGLLTMVIGLLFSTSAVVVRLGGLSTDHFTSDVQIALYGFHLNRAQPFRVRD